MAETKFEQWAIVELMGHVRMAGFVREVTIAGAGLLSIEVPEAVDDGGTTHAAYTQIVNPTSLYRITPTTEDLARSVARHSRPAAIHAWELPKPALPAAPRACEECRQPATTEDDEGVPLCAACAKTLQEEMAQDVRAKHEEDGHEEVETPDNW